jgi:hypothetical protein
MIATTIISSISVKPFCSLVIKDLLLKFQRRSAGKCTSRIIQRAGVMPGARILLLVEYKGIFIHRGTTGSVG